MSQQGRLVRLLQRSSPTWVCTAGHSASHFIYCSIEDKWNDTNLKTEEAIFESSSGKLRCTDTWEEMVIAVTEGHRIDSGTKITFSYLIQFK